MKRIKTEELQSTVKQYLKRRQYSDVVETSQKKDACNVQSIHQMAVSSFVGSQDVVTNNIVFSSISGDATACDQQYNRIKCFIHEASEPYRTELRPLLYALFVHVYLELLQNGQKTAAHKFYTRHQGVCKTDMDQPELLSQLQQLFSKEDILANPPVCEFRDHRYHVTLSSDTMGYLFRYLKSEDNVLMLQIFNKHIDVKVEGSEVVEDLVARDDRLSSNLALASPPCTPENRVVRDEATLSELQCSLRQVCDGPATAPSVCLYTLMNAYQGLCSLCISACQSLLCAGFEDSALCLWSLNPEGVVSTPDGVDVSQIQLAEHFPEGTPMKSRSTHNESVTMRGHSGPVYGVTVNTDKQVLLSASEDCTIRLWDLNSHQNRVCYHGHSYPVWDIDMSEASGFFASASQDRTAKLWSVDRKFPLRTFVGHLLDVDCVTFHMNGSYLLTGSRDRTLRLWTTQDATSVRLLTGHRTPVIAAALSPDGRLVASAGTEGRIRIWDLSSGHTLAVMKADNVCTLAFSADSSLLAAGGMDCTLRLWDVQCAAANSTSNGSIMSPALLACWPTNSVVIHLLQFTSENVLLAAGASPS